jgi:sulfate adenylyltransferase subunit 2
MEINSNHLKELENEAVFVMREVAAQFEKKVLLFSGGKDSILLVHLAKKAFWPAKMPFSLLHIDTGHNFEETLKFRDDLARELGVELIVKYVQQSIDDGRVSEEQGINASRNKAQSVTLLDEIEELGIDVAIGGGRRVEEKARAKERFFSGRSIECFHLRDQDMDVCRRQLPQRLEHRAGQLADVPANPRRARHCLSGAALRVFL